MLKKISHHVAALGKLFNDEEFSDVEIVCSDGTKIFANRCILAKKSLFFKNAFNKRLGFKEATAESITLPGDSPKAVQAMVKFMYWCDYPRDDWTGFPGPLSYHAAVCSIADKYNVELLDKEAIGYAAKLRDIHLLDLVGALEALTDDGSYAKFRDILINAALERPLSSRVDFHEFRQGMLDHSRFLIDLADACIKQIDYLKSEKTSGCIPRAQR